MTATLAPIAPLPVLTRRQYDEIELRLRCNRHVIDACARFAHSSSYRAIAAQMAQVHPFERWGELALASALMRHNGDRNAPPLAEEVAPQKPEPGEGILDRYASARLVWPDLWELDVEADDFLIAPIIARSRGHAGYASAKSRKSLFTLNMAACAATGRPFLDHPAGEKVRTVYIDAEMTPADVRERLGDMGFGRGDDLEPLAYYSLPLLPPLDTAEGGEHLLALAQAHRADLVVLDTMSRIVSGEENSNDTARHFHAHTGAKLKAHGIACFRLDHAGKELDRGMRGGSAKVDDVDVVWKIIPRDRGRLDLNATHRRVSWVPEWVHLEQTEAPLGFRRTDDSWPAGTKAAADLLDRLGVPVEHGKAKAREAMKTAGEQASNELLMAAIRYRRSPSPDVLVDLRNDQ